MCFTCCMGFQPYFAPRFLDRLISGPSMYICKIRMGWLHFVVLMLNLMRIRFSSLHSFHSLFCPFSVSCLQYTTRRQTTILANAGNIQLFCIFSVLLPRDLCGNPSVGWQEGGRSLSSYHFWVRAKRTTAKGGRTPGSRPRIPPSSSI